MPGLGIAGHLINCSYAWIEPMMWITKRVMHSHTSLHMSCHPHLSASCPCPCAVDGCVSVPSHRLALLRHCCPAGRLLLDPLIHVGEAIPHVPANLPKPGSLADVGPLFEGLERQAVVVGDFLPRHERRRHRLLGHGAGSFQR